MKISNRLETIASFINEKEVVADIGCDHAQLCCYLVKTGKCTKAYACDISEGPLQQAQKNIEYYKMDEVITAVLSDGLENISDDVTTIVIAGMGFETINHILNAYPAKLENRTIIVQSNRDTSKLRTWISSKQYAIEKEMVVYEEGHYYEIIRFTCSQGKPLNEQQIMFGVQMDKNDTYYSMWKARMGKYEKILRGLDITQPRYEEVFHAMKMIYEEFGSV